MLKLALNIQEPPKFNLDSSYKQAAKDQLLPQIKANRQKKSRSFADIFSFGLSPQLTWARVAVLVLVVFIIILMLAGGTAYAAQGSLPGDLLYPVKVGTEDARLLIEGDSSTKAKLNLKFAQTRLAEMNELANRDSERAGLAVDGYQDNLDAAGQQIRRITDTSALTNLLIGASEDMQNQLVFCDRVIDGNAAYLGLVNEASTLAVNRQVEFLEMLAQRTIIGAAQINFDAMQSRLKRVQAKAYGTQYQTMQEALIQYQQFNHLGKQILQKAQASSNHNVEIEAMSSIVLSSCLDILNGISQQVPQDCQSSIETCRQVTIQFQTQAHHKYKEQRNPDAGTDSNPNGAGEPGGTGEPGQMQSTIQAVCLLR